MAGKGRRRLVSWFVTLGVFYLVLCVLLFGLQRHLMYLPGPPPSTDPSAFGLAFEDVHFSSEDGESLHGWWVPRVTPRGTVLICHGNAGNIENRLGLVRAFHRMGLEVFVFDYRGYGRSSGTPTEQGLYRDAHAAYDLAASRAHDASRMVVYGESLGGAVAIELATVRPVKLLVTEATFTSMVEMGRKLYPWLPVAWLTRDRFESLDRVSRLAAPHVHLHSPEDDLVPIEQGRRLFQATAHPARFLETTGGHNDGGFVSHPPSERLLEGELHKRLEGGPAER